MDRLIRLRDIPHVPTPRFSFAGDTVLGSFNGFGTTTIAAAKAGRNSIGVEVGRGYFQNSIARATGEISKLAA